MTLPKAGSLSYVSLAGVVLLTSGLGLAIFASQQQQDQRSMAWDAQSVLRIVNCSGGRSIIFCPVTRRECSAIGPFSPGGIISDVCNNTPGATFTVKCDVGSVSSDITSPILTDENKYASFRNAVCSYGPPSSNNWPQSCSTDVNAERYCSNPQNGCNKADGYSGTSQYTCANGYLCCQKSKATTQPPPGEQQPPSSQPPASGGSQGSLGGACMNGWTGTCMNHNNPSSCNGTWVEGKSPWPCPNGGSNIWCCMPKTTTYSISGTVYSDKNANGKQDSGESGMQGISVTNISSPVNPVTTDANGKYSFTGLISHPTTGYPYGISVSNLPADYKVSTANPVYLYLNNSNQTVDFGIVPTGAAPPPPTNTSGGTTFAFDILFHGIGKAGDSQTSDSSGSNHNPKTHPRSVIVELYEQSNAPRLVSKTGTLTFDTTTGSYKGSIDMGSDLSNRSYIIRVKLSQSLWREITQDIKSGQSNTISLNIEQTTLKNGDVNDDGRLNGLDVQLVRRCHVDEDDEFNAEGQGATCSEDEKKKADINDDGIVNRFDLSLIFRELSNQQ